MTELVATARVRHDDLAAILAPRTHLVLEEEIEPGRFVAKVGPVHDYRRTVEIVDEVEVRQRVEYRLAIPIFGPLFALPYQRALGRIGPSRGHWWSPPEPMDARAAGMLAALCALTAVALYPASLLTQALEFVREEMGFSPSTQSLALAALRADAVVAFALVFLADRKGRRRTTVWAIGLGAVFSSLGALAPNLPALMATQIIGRGCLTGAAILMSIMAAEEMPKGCRAYAVSILTVSGALGVGAALALFPLADIGVRGWRLPFALAILTLPLVVAFGRRLPESKRFRAPHVDVTVAGHGLRIWLLGISALLFAVFLAPASQYQNVFLRRELDFSAARIALFTVATNIWGGIGIVVGGRLADIRGRRIVAAVGIVGGVGATLLMFFSVGWPVWAWSTIGAIVGAATVPALGVYGPELFPTSLRGRANGLITGLGRIGSVAGLLFVAAIVGSREHLAPILSLLAIGPALVAFLVIVAYPETAHLELEDINPEDAPPVASDV